MKDYGSIIDNLSDKLSIKLKNIIESDNIETNISIALSHVNEMINHFLLIGDIDTYEELIAVANNLSNKSGGRLYRGGIIAFSRNEKPLSAENGAILSTEDGRIILT